MVLVREDFELVLVLLVGLEEDVRGHRQVLVQTERAQAGVDHLVLLEAIVLSEHLLQRLLQVTHVGVQVVEVGVLPLQLLEFDRALGHKQFVEHLLAHVSSCLLVFLKEQRLPQLKLVRKFLRKEPIFRIFDIADGQFLELVDG